MWSILSIGLLSIVRLDRLSIGLLSRLSIGLLSRLSICRLRCSIDMRYSQEAMVKLVRNRLSSVPLGSEMRIGVGSEKNPYEVSAKSLEY